MQMHVTNDVFWVESGFHEKHIPKGAGFLWHTGTGCIGNCAACKVGAVRKWWTNKPENAAQLIAYADDKARKALTAFQNTLEQSRAEDVDDVAAFKARVPSPEGLDYLPFQRAGIMFGIDKMSVLIGDDMGLGKGLCYGTPVLTPYGHQQIEAIRVGHLVCDPDTGGAVVVTGVFPQPRQTIYRVTFSDDASVDVDGPHRWLVQTATHRNRGEPGAVMTTKELLAAGLRTKPDKRGWTNRKWFIPVTKPIEFVPQQEDLPVPAYTLGVLLGDGAFTQGSVTVSNPDKEVYARVAKQCCVSAPRTHRERTCPVFTVYEMNDGMGTKNCLRMLALNNHLSVHKFIPLQYLRAPITDRTELLRGLMDTDGDCTEGGVSTFNTSSPHLCEAVVELVRSLGGIATISKRPKPKYTYKGKKKTGAPAYRVNVRLPVNPFHLTRKAERWKKPTLARGIESIERIGRRKTICIAVDSKRNLFIADHYIVTHNTIQALGILNALPELQRVLIVVPPTLRVNWKREATKWLVDDWAIDIVEKPDDVRLVDNVRQIAIVAYTKVGGKSNEAMRKKLLIREWDALIADEIHYCKNTDSQRSQGVLGKYAKGGKLKEPGLVQASKRLIFLTGTAVTNRPVELFPLMQALDPDDIGSSFTRFAFRYCNAMKDQWGWNFKGATNLEELQTRMRGKLMIRRLKIDVLKDLPPKRRQIIALPQNGAAGAVEAQNAAFQKYEDGINELESALEVARVLKDDDAFKEAAAKLTAMKKAAFSELARERHKIAKAKVPMVTEHVMNFLETTDSKVILFAHHKTAVESFQQAFDTKGVKYVTLVGSTPDKRRSEAVDTFQNDPEVRVFIGNIIAAGVGITLTAADTVMFSELDWVPANMLQAEDRACRIGQTKSVLVQYLVFDGSIDARMANVMAEKMDVIERVLDKQDEEKQPEVTPEPEQPRKKVYPKASKERRELAAAAIRHLAALCDGAQAEDGMGFNKLDSRFGHQLAERAGQRTLTDGEVYAVSKMAKKYRRQLDEEAFATLWAADVAFDTGVMNSFLFGG